MGVRLPETLIPENSMCPNITRSLELMSTFSGPVTLLKTILSLDLPRHPTPNLNLLILAPVAKARNAVLLTLVNPLLYNLLILCEASEMPSKQSNNTSTRSLDQPISSSPYQFPSMEMQSRLNMSTGKMPQIAMICRHSVLPLKSKLQN